MQGNPEGGPAMETGSAFVGSPGSSARTSREPSLVVLPTMHAHLPPVAQAGITMIMF